MLAKWTTGVSFGGTLAPDPFIDTIFVEVMLAKIDRADFLAKLKFLITYAARVNIIILLRRLINRFFCELFNYRISPFLHLLLLIDLHVRY